MCVLGRRMNNRICNDIADRLFSQGGIRLHQRKVGGQADFDGLLCAMPPRGADHAFGHLPQVEPVAPQFQRAGIDAGNRQKIADHFIEILGLLLDLAEQVFLRRRIELVAHSR